MGGIPPEGMRPPLFGCQQGTKGGEGARGRRVRPGTIPKKRRKKKRSKRVSETETGE